MQLFPACLLLGLANQMQHLLLAYKLSYYVRRYRRCQTPCCYCWKRSNCYFKRLLSANVSIYIYPSTDDAIAEAAANSPIVISITDSGASSIFTLMDQVSLTFIAVDTTTWQVTDVSGVSGYKY